MEDIFKTDGFSFINPGHGVNRGDCRVSPPGGNFQLGLRVGRLREFVVFPVLAATQQASDPIRIGK